MGAIPLPLRKSKVKDHDPFGDLVVDSFRLTTCAQRQTVTEDFNQDRRGIYKQYAELIHIDPLALLLASLLEAGHESLCRASGIPKCNHYGQLRLMLEKRMTMQKEKL